MAKRDKTAEALDLALRMKTEPDLATVVAELRKLVANPSAIVIAKAVDVARDRGVAEQFAAQMNAAFDHFLDHADPGCAAKHALVAAGTLEVDRLLIAIKHVQMEGSYGPPVDVACAMRGNAAFALLDAKHTDALRLIVPLLDDSHRDGSLTDARRGGIRALGTVINETSAIMLRMTARRFARDPETLAECFTSLNGIEPARSVEFVATFLRSDDADVVDTAALAIAESKQPAAPKLLIDGWTRRSAMDDDARAYLTAIALTRRPESIDALLAIVDRASPRRAIEALGALELFQNDAAIRERVQAIVDKRGDRAIRAAASAFAP